MRCYRHDRTRVLARSPVVSTVTLQVWPYCFASWYGWCVSGAWKPRALISIGQVLFVPSVTNYFFEVFLLRFGVRHYVCRPFFFPCVCLFVCLFVGIKFAKICSTSCGWEGSKPLGSGHTRTKTKTATCLPKTAVRSTCQSMVSTLQVDGLARITGLTWAPKSDAPTPFEKNKRLVI